MNRRKPELRDEKNAGPGARRILGLALRVVLVMGVVVSGVWAGWHAWIQKEFAQSADRFGYLQMAADVRAGSAPQGLPRFTLDGRTARLMLGFLRERGVAVENQAAAGPNAYHYEAATDKFICQYPPGTGMMLSLLPEGAAVISWRLGAIGVLAGVGLWGVMGRRGGGGLLAAAVLVLAVMSGMGVVVVTVSYSVDMLLVPLAVVVVAGLESGRKGWVGWVLLMVAGGLLGWAVVVRLAAGLFLPGVVAAAWRANCGWGKRAGRVAVVVAAFGVGVMPLLVHQRALTGSWWHSTYTAVDDAPPGLGFVGRNLAYYTVGEGNDLFYFLVIGIVAGLVWGIRRWRTGQALSGVSAVGLWLVVPTAYFATHGVVTPYYQFLTIFVTLLGLGWIMGRAGTAESKPGKGEVVESVAAWGVAGFIVLQLMLLSWPTAELERASSMPLTTPPAELTDPGAWILADRLSGTLWHYNGIVSQRVLVLDEPMRRAFYTWLAGRGEKVYLIQDNQPMTDLMAEMTASGARFSQVGNYGHLNELTPYTRVYRVAW